MQFEVVAKPHPFRPTVVTFALPIGDTLEHALVDAAEQAGTDLRLLREAFVAVDGHRVPPALWAHTRPTGPVHIIAVPSAAVVPIIASVAAQYGAAALIPTAFALAHPIATALIIGGVTALAGALASQFLAPTPRPLSGGRDDPLTAANTITGVRNEARPYGVIPRVYGRRVSYYPVLAAQPYTEIFYDENQYIRMLFDVSYGPVAISNLKIGDTPLLQYPGISFTTVSGYPSDTPPTLFPSQVREEALSIELKYVDGYSQRRTEPDSDNVSLDVLFPNGLIRITDRNVKFGVAVRFEVQYKATSSSTWLAAPLESNHYGVYFYGSGIFEVQAKSKSAVRRSVWFQTPSRGQYDVRMRRITIDDQSDNEGDNQSVTQEQSYWTAVRSFYNAPPVNETTPIARVALRAQASDSLNGTIEQFNCTVVSILPVWTGAAWVEQQTRNPAWVFCDILRGTANARALDESRLDLTAIKAWADWCDTEGFTFDGVFDARTSVWEALQDVCATACASPAIRDGLYSVVVDNTRSSVVQHFTPRNSWDFKATKVFARRPHAVRVRFPNELTLHQLDEITVYDDGYTRANATEFEVLDLPYTTSASAAWKRARRAIAAARLRPEIYTLQTDIEHLPLTRGDLVRVTHDVPLWGLAGARVKSLATSGSNTTGVVLDAPVTMAGGTTYGLRCRLADGSTLELALTTVAGTSASLTLASPVATASGPAVGDLVMFGEYGSESTLCLVRSIEPGPDMTATVTLIDYAPAVQTSVSGTIPDFDPNITIPPAENRALPPQPRVISIDSDEDVLIRASDGTLTSRIVLAVEVPRLAGNVAAEALQARYRPADTTQDWAWLSAIPAQGGIVSIQPVDDGDTYDIQIRSVSQFGATSEWTTVRHTVVGKINPPPSVERFYRQGSSLTWPYPNPPLDLAGFVLRAAYGTSTDWGAARALHPGVVASPPFDISALSGTQTILIKAVDTSGIESATAASVTIDLGDLPVANVVETQSESPDWTGTLTGGSDTGTDIEADLLASAPMYGAAASQFYGAAGDLFYEGNYYDSMVYIARYTPVTNYLNDGLLKLELTIAGNYTIDYRISTSPAFYGASGDPFYGAAGDDFYAASAIGEWTPWPGVLGPFDTTADTYDVRLTTTAGALQGVCSQFDLITDLPDITEVLEDVIIAAGSTRLPITKTYRAIKAVNITVQTDGNGGISARLIDKDASLGPDTEVLNASGTAVQGLVDAAIWGY